MLGEQAPGLRKIEGDSIVHRLRLYRRSIFFHILAKVDHTDRVSQQLRENQNPNGKDEKGRTALHYACRHGTEGKETVQILLNENNHR